MKISIKRKYRFLAAILLLLSLLAIVISNFTIEISARGKTFNDPAVIPKNKVGLVLGTSRMLVEGGVNPYYAHRINATIKLYKAGKIEYVLVSGDNGSIYYNEPTTIKKDLVKRGIPGEKIFLDYAGFRTLDSMVRAKFIFGLDSVTVISQQFHNERAIYLAEKKGLMAIGFNAKGISGKEGIKVQFREYFARVKVFIDLLLNTQPRFYGEKIEIK
ncbi:MAG: ElyC/SanA/YdcF family protein [Eudoraea sp.]|uniref:SanA/YdcF family protein n=1 Tax=Eudoraea sp. TaxID=1979955 RepID=UPI003C709BCF